MTSSIGRDVWTPVNEFHDGISQWQDNTQTVLTSVADNFKGPSDDDDVGEVEEGTTELSNKKCATKQHHLHTVRDTASVAQSEGRTPVAYTQPADEILRALPVDFYIIYWFLTLTTWCTIIITMTKINQHSRRQNDDDTEYALMTHISRTRAGSITSYRENITVRGTWSKLVI